ncbi:hypothetical protein DFP92_10542 [Yoonia sediminilitoris]|uniref:Uncharacterized protein n=1 Tax=Yoonia sediminilitoris TaxID=1286148 RepID=A0A2T6KH82_9RHOB|nr:hypothetical protein C8N45_10542 [Yoonia sediminilitoris]RCW95538.1 hypothetical protein DFP92_10542 [Yoonia sediminilitoris]
MMRIETILFLPRVILTVGIFAAWALRLAFEKA